MEGKIRYLEIIQGIINRMASNSFYLKGWTVTLILGLLALKSELVSFYILLIPVLFFWLLDSYYLSLERKYRKLYDTVRLNEVNDFNLTLPRMNKKKKYVAYFRAFVSKSELFFYLPLLVVSVVFSFVQSDKAFCVVMHIRSIF